VLLQRLAINVVGLLLPVPAPLQLIAAVVPPQVVVVLLPAVVTLPVAAVREQRKPAIAEVQVQPLPRRPVIHGAHQKQQAVVPARQTAVVPVPPVVQVRLLAKQQQQKAEEILPVAAVAAVQQVKAAETVMAVAVAVNVHSYFFQIIHTNPLFNRADFFALK
jgi:hypothetical protein